ncbi:hypothetical protein CJ030_MR2G010230 [Morella rubra]|uniref:Transcription repressor n=1 Tax=Morella rubra TaxID=262757 RepID=A0A6A1WCM5_9ROSI|nr:hypothetical protein CJ030_MR2G010230 [Morella rubra]
MSSNKKSLFKTIFASSTGRGCGCSKARPSDVIEPQPTQKQKITGNGNRKPCTTSSSSSCDKNDGLSVDDGEYFTSTAISEAETDPKSPEIPISCKKIMGSIAVEKDSTDPYQDFRHSMLQMILEKQIYSKEDLQELLSWFLKLNSPSQHEVICKAFREIWDEVISEKLILREPCAEGESSQQH